MKKFKLSLNGGIMAKDRLKNNKFMARDMILYLPAKIFEGIIGILAIKMFTSMLSISAYDDFSFMNTIVNFANIICFGWLVNATFHAEPPDHYALVSYLIDL